MIMKKLNFKKRVKCIVMMMFMLSVLYNPVLLFADTGSTVITIDGYSVTDEQIVPGKDFELKLILRNNSSKSSGRIYVDIINPDGVTPEYGTVTQCVVDNIKANSTYEVKFKYYASPNLLYEYVDFNVGISSDASGKNVPVRIPVGAENQFQIVSQNVPETGAVNENISANVGFQILGSDNVTDVVLMVKNNNDIIGTSSVGTITAGATKNQGITFSFSEEGSYDVDLVVSYKTSSGAASEMKLGTHTVVIGKNSTSTAGHSEYNPDEERKNLLFVMAIGILMIGVIFVIIRILKKERDRR